MNNAALITGASSGIGRELAILHAKAGGDVVIVARRQDELERLKQELETLYSIQVLVVVQDLASAHAAQEIFQMVDSQGIQIEYLVNNAGFGGYGLFYERDLVKDEAMIQVNILVLTQLTRLFLPKMVERRAGRILNIASVAAYLPGPFQAVYYASKAYVLSFSQAIAEELRGTGVTVTAFCPGPVETGFAKVANAEHAPAFREMAQATQVAQVGYRAMMQGELVAFHQLRHKYLLEWMLPFIPRSWVLRISRRMMEKLR